MPQFLSRLLAPIASKAAATAAEAVALPLLALVLSAWASPSDPLFTRAEFPWPWLAPLLIALRYGPLWGMASAGVLLAGWFGLEGLRDGHLLPKLYFLGGLITTMLAGEFASVWQLRLRRAEATQEYLDRRLDALTRTHYLLRLSHESLEQDLLSRPVSMRDALVGLRELVAGIESGPDEALPAADKLLKLAVQFCQIERAALVPLGKAGPDASRAVFLGAPFEIRAEDPLVRHAIGQSLLSHVASRAAERREDSRYLIVAPVRDTTRHVHALLLVETLPFLALQEENLQMLNLMLGYYADSLVQSPLVAPLHARWPDCPSTFALELQRLYRMQREAGVPSTLVALIFPREGLPAGLPASLQRQQRSLDVSWLVRNEADERALLAILPLATGPAVEGYLARIERWTTTQYGRDLASLGIQSHTLPFGGTDPAGMIAAVMETCDVAEQARPGHAAA